MIYHLNMLSNVIDFERLDKILNIKDKNKKKVIDIKLNTQRENRIAENKKRQERLGTLVEKYNKRIDKIQQENVKNHLKKLDANYQKAEQMQQRLQNHKILERRKVTKILQFIKDKDLKSKKLLADNKKLKLHEKQKRDIENYYKKVEYQNITIVKNQQLIEKCLINRTLDDIENSDQELFVEHEEEMKDEDYEIEEIAEEECVIDSDQSVIISS